MLLSSSADFEKKTDMMLIWSHEVFRVFYDRLTDDDDRLWFIEEMKKLTLKHFEVEMDTLFAEFDMNNSGDVDDDDVRYLMYSQHTDPKAAKKIYRRVKDLDQMQKHMVQYLEDYNHISSKPMKLVLFLFAVEHIMKIARVLSMPRGNALLAGVGGSGRQSVTRLAAHISDMDVFSIEVSKSYSMNDWREDLKTVLRKAGAEGKPSVFLFVRGDSDSNPRPPFLLSILASYFPPCLIQRSHAMQTLPHEVTPSHATRSRDPISRVRVSG